MWLSRSAVQADIKPGANRSAGVNGPEQVGTQSVPAEAVTSDFSRALLAGTHRTWLTLTAKHGTEHIQTFALL